jgi:hypothetical protein
VTKVSLQAAKGRNNGCKGSFSPTKMLKQRKMLGFDGKETLRPWQPLVSASYWGASDLVTTGFLGLTFLRRSSVA